MVNPSSYFSLLAPAPQGENVGEWVENRKARAADTNSPHSFTTFWEDGWNYRSHLLTQVLTVSFTKSSDHHSACLPTLEIQSALWWGSEHPVTGACHYQDPSSQISLSLHICHHWPHIPAFFSIKGGWFCLRHSPQKSWIPLGYSLDHIHTDCSLTKTWRYHPHIIFKDVIKLCFNNPRGKKDVPSYPC